MSKSAKILGFTALAIAMFMGTLDSTIINIALPDIMIYFKANLNDTSWISTIYVLGLSVFMISASKLADQFGRKKIMLIGLVLFGASSALCSLSKTLLFLIAMRLIQGIGGAIITPIVVPMALELFGTQNTQKVAGAVGAVTAIAAAGGPPIGGVLIKYINWQAIFFVNVPFALIAFLLTVFFINESYDKTISKSIDWLGMMLLTAALFLLTFSLLKGKDYGWGSTLIISMLIGSAVSAVFFLLVESRVKAPLVELELFREFTFTASSVCYLITGFGIVAPLLIFNFFLQNALGYEALNAAYIVMAVSLTVIVSMPLGSVIAGKLGARPVNFCGVLFMSGGALLLSRITFDTSKFVMVINMIVFGFGLGFSCQSLVSSIKHLPAEKSGIGSGIVNAARQIGTCIGIALLVSILNSNVSSAKNDIESNADAFIQKSSIADIVKTTMLRDINDSFSTDDENDSSTQQQDLKQKMQDDIKKAVKEISTVQKPADKTLAQLYNGVETLSDGITKANDGQKALNSGISSLNSGLDKLLTGSDTLTSGLGALSNGLSKATSGAQTLNSASDQGLGALTSGIGQLNNGAQTMLQQFSPSNDPKKPTVYDGVTGVEKGTQSLSSNLNNYVSAVNNTYYLMIKSNIISSQLLTAYKNHLEQAQAAYTSAVGTSKEQYAQQVKALANLVALYTAGTDPSVTTEAQFEAKLENLAKQNNANQNVVSGGNQMVAGAKQLSSASSQVAAQFSNGGSFKNGMQQMANGTSKLNQSCNDLSALQAGNKKLMDSLSQLKDGSNKLLTGAQNLQSGMEEAKNGSDSLLLGSNQLVEANSKMNDGVIKIANGVGLAGQQNEIETVMSQIQAEKNDKLSGAFDKVFLLTAIILAVASVCALFTDKKQTN
jgi:drug resistance transporter, EmrB/QacA subfamily